MQNPGGGGKYAEKQEARRKGERPAIAAAGGDRQLDIGDDWRDTGAESPSMLTRPEEQGYDFGAQSVLMSYTYLIAANQETQVRIQHDAPITIPAVGEGSDVRALTVVAVQTGIHEAEDHWGRPTQMPIWDIGYIRGRSETDARGKSAFEVLEQVIVNKTDVHNAIGKWSNSYGHSPASTGPSLKGAERVSKMQDRGYRFARW